MNEAKASFNSYFRSPNGGKDQFTLRQTDEQSDKEFLARVRQFVKLLAENGWTEWEQASGAAESQGRGAEEREDRPDEGASRNGKYFEVESIKLAAGGEHPRWVVKGGNFKKFGVTCWPETLEAAGIGEKLDPLKDNKPKGNWMAHYTERQNDDGKWVPEKVTRLVKQ
jgi:hypothetical protein